MSRDKEDKDLNIFTPADPEVKELVEEMKKEQAIHKRERVITSITYAENHKDIVDIVTYLKNYDFIYSKSINNNNKFLYLNVIANKKYIKILNDHLEREFGGIEYTEEGNVKFSDTKIIKITEEDSDDFFNNIDYNKMYSLSVLSGLFDRIFSPSNTIICFVDFNSYMMGDIVSKFSGGYGNTKTEDNIICVPFHTMIVGEGEYLAIVSDSVGVSPNFSVSHALLKEAKIFNLFTPGTVEYIVNPQTNLSAKKLSILFNLHDFALRVSSSPYVDTIKVNTNVFYYNNDYILKSREYHKYLRRMLFHVFPKYWDKEDVVKNEIIEEISGNITGFKDRDVVYTDSTEKRNGVIRYDVLVDDLYELRKIMRDAIDGWDSDKEDKDEDK